jgi:hypothetical protein
VTLAVEYTTDKSAALTGESDSAAAGTVTPSGAKPLTGDVTTASAGTLTAVLPRTHGQQIDAAQGTLTYVVESSAEEALEGAEATAAAGTQGSARFVGVRSRKVGGGSATHALSGQAMTSAFGLFTPVPSKTPTGQVATLLGGSVGRERSVPVVGSSATASSGVMTGSGGTVGATVSTMSLTTAGASGSYPVTFGYAFKQGDVPSGQFVTSPDCTSFQCDIRNKWSDGSLKFGVMSALLPLTQNVKKTISLATRTTQPGTNLTEANLVTALSGSDVVLTFTSVRDHNNATLGTGTLTANLSHAIGTSKATWSDRSTPGLVRSVLGPVMSEFHYYEPTADPHVAVWFYVRLYSNNAIEVETMVENGWLNQASPGERRYTVSMAIAGSTVYSASLNHLSRTRWSRVDWVGTDRTVTPEHDPAYLRSTRLVPNYGYTNPTSGAFSGLASAINPVPFSLGNWNENMGDTGAAPAIGILPKWEVLYCTTGDSRAYAAMVSNNRSAGRWQIHYRDETTGRIPSYATYPNMTLQSGWGSQPPSGAGGSTLFPYDHAHHPSTGFMHYLVTGRWAALEELQFVAAFCFFDCNYATRSLLGLNYVTPCINSPMTTRGVAWTWRSIGQAAGLSPVYLMGSAAASADALMQTMNRSSVADTASFHNQRFVAGTSDGGTYRNTIGWVGQYGGDNYNNGSDGPSSTVNFWGASWMVDFQVQCMGYISDLGIEGLTTTNLHAVRAHMYRGLVERFGNESTWNFRRAINYGAPYLKNSSTPGAPVFMTQAERYTAYKAFLGMSALSSVNGESIKGHTSDTDITTGGTSNFGAGYAASTMTALAYAVEHQAAGAVDALLKLTSASNFDASAAHDTPQFSAIPRPVTYTWQNATLNRWTEITGSAMALTPPTVNPGGSSPASKLDAWGGVSLDARTGDVWLLAGGGHGDYSGNEVMRLRLGSNAPAWVEMLASSPASAVTVASARYTDNRPASAHCYYSQQFSELRDRAMRFGSQAVATSANTYPNVEAFNSTVAAGVNGWDAAGTFPNIPAVAGGGLAMVKNPLTGDVYLFNDASALYKWTQATNTWSSVPASIPVPTGEGLAMFDTARNRIFIYKSYNSATTCYTMDVATSTFTARTLTGAAASALNAAAKGVGGYYEPALDAYLVRDDDAGGTVYRIGASAFDVTLLSTSNGGAIPAPGSLSGPTNVYGRFVRVPAMRGALWIPSYSANAWFLRTH